MNYADLPEKLARVVDLKAFAAKAGVSRGTLYNVMKPVTKAGPSLRTLEKIATALREHRPAMRPKSPT